MASDLAAVATTTNITVPIYHKQQTESTMTPDSHVSPSRPDTHSSLEHHHHHHHQQNLPSTPSPTPSSPSTTLTTPDPPLTQDASGHPSLASSSSSNDDIWASDSDADRPAPPHPSTSPTPPNVNTTLLSDLPTLRRQHMTSGYREGLSAGKARVIQSGFDAGYPTGVAIAMRAGRVVGVLEGVVAGYASPSSSSSRKKDRRVVVGVDHGRGEEDRAGKGESQRDEMVRLLETARRELKVTALMGGIDEAVVSGLKGGEVPGVVDGVLRRWEGRVGLGSD